MSNSMKMVDNQLVELTDAEQQEHDNNIIAAAAAASAYENDYARKRTATYTPIQDFMEAYTEKEIGGDSTKWDAYVIAYNKVRTDNPKP